MRENNREKGSRYEEQAAAYLIGQGFEILARNFRCRTGEIDLIAREDRYLCFVEVKYRASGRQGEPEEAVHAAKQRKLYQTAECYLKYRGLSWDTPCRFDVVSVTEQEIRLLRNAFGSF